jgi:hypothetical protein
MLLLKTGVITTPTDFITNSHAEAYLHGVRGQIDGSAKAKRPVLCTSTDLVFGA